MAGSVRRCPHLAHGARTLLQSSRAFGLITLATGSAPVAETCAEATIWLSSVPVDCARSNTARGDVALRVVPEDPASALPDWVSPLSDDGGALNARPGRLLLP